MEFTKRQRRRLHHYLKEVESHFEDLPQASRIKLLRRVQRNIEEALAHHGADTVEDTQVEEALEELGTPSELANRLRPREDTPTLGEERVWLGVCAALARHFDADPRLIRTGAAAVGLVGFLFLPVLLVAYIGGFFALYYGGHRAPTPPIDYVKTVKAALIVLLACIVLRAFTGYLVEGVRYGLSEFFDIIVPFGSWAWIAYRNGPFFWWSVWFLTPLGVLSALPVPPAWSGTLWKTTLAGLALYTLALAFGIASFVTGIFIHLSSDLADLESLRTLL